MKTYAITQNELDKLEEARLNLTELINMNPEHSALNFEISKATSAMFKITHKKREEAGIVCSCKTTPAAGKSIMSGWD